MLAKDSDDSEPSLSVPEPGGTSSCHWSRAGFASYDHKCDLADNTDDRKDDSSELEPWLGAPATTNYGQTADQRFTWSSLGGVVGTCGYEHDPAESGIADYDGLDEQRL